LFGFAELTILCNA